MAKKVGILALQGDFALHAGSIERSGARSKEIRRPEQLKDCDALILPGGESTALVKLLNEANLMEGIREFAKSHPIMGTCAGLILLATKVVNYEIKTLGLIEMSVERNAYGRQIDSFIDEIYLFSFMDKRAFEGVFIRAPKIISFGKNVKGIGFFQNEIVMARNDNILVMTFHPELTQDHRIHAYFINNFV